MVLMAAGVGPAYASVPIKKVMTEIEVQGDVRLSMVFVRCCLLLQANEHQNVLTGAEKKAAAGLLLS